MRTCKSLGDEPAAHGYQNALEFKLWNSGFRVLKPESRVGDVKGFAPVSVSAISPPRMETSCLKACHARKGYPYRCLPRTTMSYQPYRGTSLIRNAPIYLRLL